MWPIVGCIIVVSGFLGIAENPSEQSEPGPASVPSPDGVPVAPTAETADTVPPSETPSDTQSEDIEDIEDRCDSPGGRSGDLPRNTEHTLKESNFVTTSKNDKVDLDTGEPGYGSMPQGAWNPDSGGRLADLIVEHDEVHTACRTPQMYLMTQGDADAGVKACRRAVKSEVLSSSIRLAELTEGSVICVRTDEGLVARVEIQYLKTTYPTTLTITAIVAEP